jgi:uncharacterized protein DUF234
MRRAVGWREYYAARHNVFWHNVDATSWEELCRLAVPRLSATLGAAFGVPSRYWGGGGSEWDVVARADRTCLLGEVKWMTEAPSAAKVAAIYAQLLAKGRPPFAQADVVHALFVPLLPRNRPRALPANVRLVDAQLVLQALRADQPPSFAYGTSR